MKKIMFALVAVVALAACKGKNAVPDQTLLNTRWMLETIGEEKIDNSSEQKPFYMFLEDGSYKLNGFAGCNNFFGSFLVGKADELMVVGARPQLVNSKWLLEAIGDEVIENTNKENPIYVELSATEEGNRLAGMAGCNRYFGEFTESGEDSLLFDKMGSTRMMCDRMDVEGKYLKALESVDSYQVDGLYLYLKSKGAITITYKVAEESLRFNLASTMMACDKMEIENKFFKAITDVRKYDVDGLNLYLFNAEGKRMLGFKAFYEE